MKPVLIIASGFPPQGGGGVTRVHSFVKYLPLFGWQPIVLTLHEKYAYIHAIDDSLLSDYSELVEIYRTGSLEPSQIFKPNFQNQSLNTNLKSSKVSGIVRRSAKCIHQQLIIPDEKVLWMPMALKTGRKIIRDKGVEIAFITTPPHSVSLIGYFLKKLTDVKMVWDIRDDWIGNQYFESKVSHRRRAEEFLESKIIKKADDIIVVSEPSRTLLMGKYPSVQTRVHLIPNGFDSATYPVDYKNGSLKQQNKKCQIIYTGSLTQRRVVPEFWKAIAELRDSKLISGNKLEIILVGSVHQLVLNIIRDWDLSDIVSLKGHVSQKESLEYLLQANASLLISTIDEGAKTAIPSKFYEYIGARKFVIALAEPNSASAQLMRQASVGIAVSPTDKQGIKNCILRVLKLNENGQLSVDMAENWIEQFERKKLTEKLANVLNFACKNA